MADLTLNNVFGVTDKNHAGDISAGNFDDGEVLTDTDMWTVAAMRTRLAAISGTIYTAARLNSMTPNDMVYALRMEDHASTV